MNNEKVIVITGCSTGIGRALCRILTDKGYTVVATARNVESLDDLLVSMKLPLDVTKKETISAAVNNVISRFHKIDILINNAGFSLRGALEEINVEKAKNMFDVNVFGIIQMTQAVVPQMRRQQSGRIINIGSISRKFAQPINGIYCASKFAVEALNDTLRLELCHYNIESTVIEPGPINTDFFKTLDCNSHELLSHTGSCYAGYYQSDEESRSRQKRTSVEDAARVITNIVMKKQLRPRYKVAVPFAFRLISHFPDSLREYCIRKR